MRIIINFFVLLMLSSMLFLLSGCVYTGNVNHDFEDCKIVYNGFKNKDSSEILKLFCEKSATTYDLEEQLEGAFDFIDGNIKSRGKFTAGCGGSSVREGVVENDFSSAYIENITTDSGELYEIIIFNQNVYPKDETIVGLQRILVVHEDKNDQFNDLGQYEIGDQYP